LILLCWVYKRGKFWETLSLNCLKNSDSVIVEQAYKGLWVLVDNGYLAWPMSMPPYMQILFDFATYIVKDG